MNGPRVLVGEPTGQNRGRHAPPDPDAGWRLVKWVGLALAVVAYGDMALGIFPLQIGNPEWEFGTVSRLLDSLPLATMATLLFLAGSVAGGERVLVRLVGVWSLVFGLVLIGGLVLYALTVPLALSSVTDEVARGGLIRAMAKTGLQGVVYPATFLALGWYGLRKAARA